MYCYTLTALALCMSVVNAGDDAKKEAIAKELKLLEGSWDQIWVVEGGKKTVTPEGVQLRTIVRAGAYRLEGDGKIYAKGVLKPDPSKKPKAVDILPSEGPAKGKSFLAIYEVKGDELRMCVAQPGQPRPTAFSSEEGSDNTLQSFRRVKPKE